MTQAQIKTLKMIYKNRLKYIDCAKKAKYEECIEIALEHFNIPSKFREFIQVTNDYGKIFDKNTFEYYNQLFPNPEIIFFVKIDNEKFKKQHSRKERKPLAELNIKRKRCNENEEGSTTSKNSSPESLYEIERNKSWEPAAKKLKPSCSKPSKTSWWHLLFSKLFD